MYLAYRDVQELDAGIVAPVVDLAPAEDPVAAPNHVVAVTITTIMGRYTDSEKAWESTLAYLCNTSLKSIWKKAHERRALLIKNVVFMLAVTNGAAKWRSQPRGGADAAEDMEVKTAIANNIITPMMQSETSRMLTTEEKNAYHKDVGTAMANAKYDLCFMDILAAETHEATAAYLVPAVPAAGNGPAPQTQGLAKTPVKEAMVPVVWSNRPL
jgi:hypothetical protein